MADPDSAARAQSNRSPLLDLPAELLDGVIQSMIGTGVYQYHPPYFSHPFHGRADLQKTLARHVRQYLGQHQSFSVREVQQKYPGLIVDGASNEWSVLFQVSKFLKSSTEDSVGRSRVEKFVLKMYDLHGVHYNRSLLSALAAGDINADDHHYISSLFLWPTDELERFANYVLPTLEIIHAKQRIANSRGANLNTLETFFSTFKSIEFRYDAKMLFDVASWRFNFADVDVLSSNIDVRYTALNFPNEMKRVSTLAKKYENKFKIVITGLQHWYENNYEELDPVPTTRRHREGSPDSNQSSDAEMKHEHLWTHLGTLFENAVLEGDLAPEVEVYVSLRQPRGEVRILPHDKMTELLEAVGKGNHKGRTLRLKDSSMRHYVLSNWMTTVIDELKPELENKAPWLITKRNFAECGSGCTSVDVDWNLQENESNNDA